MEQIELFPEDPKKEKPVDKDKVDKAKARAVENEEFKDKRVKASPLTVQAELAKMKEILAKPKSGSGGGGVPSDKMDKMKKMNYKSGGPISKAVMQKAGFYDKGKTEKERQDIVKKVTTKPQRVAMVAKAFSTKNMNEGGKVGSASKRADGCAIRGKTRA